MIRFLSVCSGIEAASVAWGPLGWSPIAFAEIDAFPSAVLMQRFPSVPNLGDFTAIQELDEQPDLLVGGTPCQSFSVAGLRAGMADARGNLALEYLALAGRLRPRWLVWENVPGVLSSDGGRALGAFLGGLAELGYGWAYRVLDAQHFGLAQRRARVFVVGHLGDWRRAAAVLLERASLRGDPAPSRETREGSTHDLAPCIGASGRGFERTGETRGQDPVVAFGLNAHHGRLDGESETLLTDTLRSHTRPGSWNVGNIVAHALRAEGFDASEDGTGRGTPIVTIGFPSNFSSQGIEPGMSPTLAGGTMAVAFQESQSGCREHADAGSLRANGPGHDPVGTRIREGMAVRRLTPTECERLQGFPDGWTAVQYRGKPASDGPRYKALGNSMAVPVARWIGERIESVEAITTAHGGA